MREDPHKLVQAVQQAVEDVRRTGSFLASLEHIDGQRIGLCGVSLGGMIAALAGGVDGQFPRVALVMAGGDLASLVTGSEDEVRGLREAIERKGLTVEEVETILEPIEPLTFAERLRHGDLLMINATRDPIVAAEAARKLAAAGGGEITWFDTDHYGLIQYIVPTLKRVGDFFAADPW